jgi:multiple sugar transport system ATP-binding protein
VTLPTWSTRALDGLRGEVLLGIRPEDLYEAGPPGDGRPENGRTVPLAMRVVAVEPLGAETLLVLLLDGCEDEVIARIGRETALRPGDEATIHLDTTSLHLFDPATTRVIARV